jgi:hypothetical protein
MHIHQHSTFKKFDAGKQIYTRTAYLCILYIYVQMYYLFKKKERAVDCGVEEDGGRKEQTAAAVQKNGCCESEM